MKKVFQLISISLLSALLFSACSNSTIDRKAIEAKLNYIDETSKNLNFKPAEDNITIKNIEDNITKRGEEIDDLYEQKKNLKKEDISKVEELQAKVESTLTKVDTALITVQKDIAEDNTKIYNEKEPVRNNLKNEVHKLEPQVNNHISTEGDGNNRTVSVNSLTGDKQKISDVTFNKDGYKVSQKSYNADGSLKKEIIYYEDGRTIKSEKTYNSDGTSNEVDYNKNGGITKKITYDDHGKPIAESVLTTLDYLTLTGIDCYDKERAEAMITTNWACIGFGPDAISTVAKDNERIIPIVDGKAQDITLPVVKDGNIVERGSGCEGVKEIQSFMNNGTLNYYYTEFNENCSMKCQADFNTSAEESKILYDDNNKCEDSNLESFKDYLSNIYKNKTLKICQRFGFPQQKCI